MDPSWYLYLTVFIGPFVQEDAAVIGAATLSASDANHFPVIFFVILSGLIASDVWKYWIGYAALSHPRLRRYAEKERVVEMQDKVASHTFITLLAARFIPLARVPAYVACGYFKISYAKFCAIIALTALLYVLVIFAVCHWLGEIFGDRMEWMLGSLAAVAILIFACVWWIRKLRAP